MGTTNWQDVIKIGSVVATIALSAGTLLAEVRGVRGLLEEQKQDLKAAATAIQMLQIEGARRSAEFILIERRLNQIEVRLNINR